MRKTKKNQDSKPNEGLKDKGMTVARLMASAQAHQRTSVYCMDNPEAKPPNIDWFFYAVVSLELILFSLDQSLRLLYLLQEDDYKSDSHHSAFLLYRQFKPDIRKTIVEMTNTIGRFQNRPLVTEKGIRKCLEKHRSSYINFRHFNLSKQGNLNPDSKFGYISQDIQIIHCLALALISLNINEMKKQNLPFYSSISKIPFSEMTDKQRELLILMRDGDNERR